MQLIFHRRDVHGKHPQKDENGTIVATGVLGELVDEESTYVTEDIVTVYGSEDASIANLAVGKFVTVELNYGGEVFVCDLYRVS